MMGETSPGALADRVTARTSQLIPIPDNVSDSPAAAVPVAHAAAWRMLHTCGAIQAGEKVLNPKDP